MNKKIKEEKNINWQNCLFNYVKPVDNNVISDMNGLDLQEFLFYLNNYYLELRNKLGLNCVDTFGLEIEFENEKDEFIKSKLLEMFPDNSWVYKRDLSLLTVCGAEINSPILSDNKIVWDDLNRVCSMINEHAGIDKLSGGHIHIGTQVLGADARAWINFIKMWTTYENIIYRFSYGNMLSHRMYINKYAQPLQQRWNKFIKKFERHVNICRLNLDNFDSFMIDEFIIDKCAEYRAQAVNLLNASPTNDCSEKNTIEFRCPNGTLDPVIWQNNVNFFVNLLNYCKSPDFNLDIIKKRRLTNKNKYKNLKLYNQIYLDQAIELADMIFNNNLDKMYFLRQYLKNFEIATKNKWQASPFTKIKNK